MEKVATQFLGEISDYLKNNPSVWQGALAAGALGGIGGAALTPEGSEDETRAERNKRRLKNALILGALGAAGGGLLASGMSNIVDEVKKPVSKELDKVQAAKDLLANPITRGVAGTAVSGLAARRMMRNEAKAAEELIAALGKGTPGTLQSAFDDVSSGPANEFTQALGKDSPKGLRGVINRIRYLGANPNEAMRLAEAAGIDFDKTTHVGTGWGRFTGKAPRTAQRWARKGIKGVAPGLITAFLPEIISGAGSLVNAASPGAADSLADNAKRVAQ